VMDAKVQKSVRGALNKEQYMNALYDVWIKQRNPNKPPKPSKSDVPLPKRGACAISTVSTNVTGKTKKRVRRNSDKTIISSGMTRKTYDMKLQWCYLEQIQAGLKTVEGRPHFDDLDEIENGDILRFKVCAFPCLSVCVSD